MGRRLLLSCLCLLLAACGGDATSPTTNDPGDPGDPGGPVDQTDPWLVANANPITDSGAPQGAKHSPSAGRADTG